MFMEVQLDPNNVRTWNLFWDMRHHGQGILELYQLDLPADEAGDILVKLRALSEAVMSIEAQRQKEHDAKMKAATRGR